MKRGKPRRSRATHRSAEPTAVSVVKRYIARINAGDSAGLAELSGAGLRFVDATGAKHVLSRDAWDSYFSEFPDYRIEVKQILSEGGSVGVFGTASGSYRGRGTNVPGAAWQTPAAWRARVRFGKIVEWQVYLDVEPMLQSAGLGRSSRA